MNNDFEQSMIYERAFAETNYLMENIRKKQLAAIAKGEERNEYFELVTNELRKMKEKFRKESDDAFIRHRNMEFDLDSDGIINLVVAVGSQMATDYEIALCKKNENDKAEIEAFAGDDGKLYEILERIRVDKERFAKKAHEEILSLIRDTNELRKARDNQGMGSKRNPHRCPLCKGGMYVRSKLKENTFLVGCTGCFLTEVVKVYQ